MNGTGMQICKKRCPQFLCLPLHRNGGRCRKRTVLRAVINGRLFSVPEDFYDHFIRSEIENQNDEFQEGQLIGRILGKYQLGISDGWLAMRIEKMIENGKLQIITNAPSDCPAYHRVIRKIT